MRMATFGSNPMRDGGEHRGAKHGDHVLHAHGGGLRPRQALVGCDDGAPLGLHLAPARGK